MCTFRVPRLPAALLAFSLVLAAPASGADIVVNTNSDGVVAPIGACKLRSAVQAANTDTAVGNCAAGNGADRIVFQGVRSITLLPSGLVVTRPLTIDGGGTLVRIRRDPGDTDVFRILHVTEASATLTLRWIAIESGQLDGVADPNDRHGAGIRSNGRVILEDSRVSNNHAIVADGDGGGIFANDVELLRSEVSNNTASDKGAGIHAQFATLVDSLVEGNVAAGNEGAGGGLYAVFSASASRSTFSGNRASVHGGGLSAPTLTLRNSTLSGNEADVCGGGLVGFTISVQNSTITNNASGDNASGGICAVAVNGAAHSLSISNSIVWGNLGDIGTLAEPVGAAGVNNIIGPVGGSVSLPADTVDCDPGLAPLADNGGPTPTHAIAAGSCARDNATNPFDLPTDQRGEPRTSGGGTDIGAYELHSVDVFGDGFES